MTEIFTQNDFWTNLKERLTNPFLLSFVLSWLIWNWPITIGLVWYNAENINRFGYSSYDSLIKCNTNWIWNLLLPLLSALIYTFCFPFFRKVVNSFNAKIDKEDQDNVLEIAGTGNIPTLTFLELQKTYDERIKSLSDLIKTQSVTKSENITLSITIDQKKKEVEELKKLLQSAELSKNLELDRLFRNGSIKMLNGKWSGEFLTSGALGSIESTWEFQDGVVYIQSKKHPREEFVITTYLCNPITREAVLMISGKNGKEYKFTNLIWNNGFQKLESKAVFEGTLYLNLDKHPDK